MKTFLLKLYSYSFLNRLSFMLPFIVLMFQEHGLSAFQISIIISAMPICEFLTEIPSGVLADRFSRKMVLIIAQILKIGCYTSWILFPNFWGFLFGYVLLGLEISLRSGCLEAFIYDELKSRKKKKLYNKVLGSQMGFSTIATSFGCFASAYLIRYSYNLIIVVNIICLILSTFILISIKSEYEIGKKNSTKIKDNGYFTILKKGSLYAFKYKTILKLLLFLSFTGALYSALREYFPIFLNEISNSKEKVAIIVGILAFLIAIGGFTAEHFKNVCIKNLTIFYALFMAICFAGFALYIYPLSLILVLPFVTISMINYINVTSKMQSFVPSRVRSTVLSVVNFTKEIFFAIALFGFGAIADLFSYRISFSIFSGSLSIVAAIFIFIFARDKRLIRK